MKFLVSWRTCTLHCAYIQYTTLSMIKGLQYIIGQRFGRFSNVQQSKMTDWHLCLCWMLYKQRSFNFVSQKDIQCNVWENHYWSSTQRKVNGKIATRPEFLIAKDEMLVAYGDCITSVATSSPWMAFNLLGLC